MSRQRDTRRQRLPEAELDINPGSKLVATQRCSVAIVAACPMVDSSPHLSSRLDVIRSPKRIVDHRSRSFYKALSAGVSTKDGLNAHVVLIDELHAQKTRDLWDSRPCLVHSVE